MSILNEKYTLTTIFILPLVNITKSILSIRNCYIGTTNEPEKDGKLHIFYNDNLIDIIEIPDIYKGDYDKFLIGKYSKFSKPTKDKIISFWSDKCSINPDIFKDIEVLKGILYKTDYMKDKLRNLLNLNVDKFSENAEFFPAPNLLNEIY